MSRETTLNEPERFKNLALNYLNENYDDNFTARGYTGTSWSQSYRTVTFRSEKYPDYSAITVKIYDEDNGGYYFVDNYYQCYMYDDSVDYFEDIVEGIEPIMVKVRFGNWYYSSRLNGATSFAEWVANETCWLEVFFITQETLSDEDMENIVQNIAENKIYGRIWFITTSSVDDVINLSLSDILNNQSTYVESMSTFYIGTEYEIERTD